jgi:catechol 2,3-dioxygenase-like lactoylglutathione lyase family enzyme
MAFHHVAIATRDIKATHEFYTGPMGFQLVKVVTGATPEKGWAKHLFYETGGGELIAFWDIHDENLPADRGSAISDDLGLPHWANHIAFGAEDLAEIEVHRRRLLQHGVDVVEIDHGWCVSIYANDPNGIMVEFCTTTRAFTDADAEEAQRLLADPEPPLEKTPKIVVYRASEFRD